MTRTARMLAIAGLFLPLSSIAQTDSSAILYGVVDLSMGGISRQDEGTSLRMQSGVQSGSRWGLRGSETLGNGLRANYLLESGFLANEGRSAQGGRLFGRAAWAGLSGPMGELRLGRHTSVSSITLSDYDAFLASYMITGAQTTLLPFNANRADNTIAYWTPSAAGWRAGMDYSTGYDSQGFGTSSSSKLMSAAIVYTQTRYSLTATYEKAKWGHGSSQRQAMMANGGYTAPYAYTLAGKWMGDSVTLYAAWSLMRNGSTIPAVPSPGQLVNFAGSSVQAAMVGAAWRVGGASTLLASFQTSRPNDSGELGKRGATGPQNVYSAGYTYDLSKRTNFYAIYGYMDRAWNTPDWHESQYALGIRHRF